MNMNDRNTLCRFFAIGCLLLASASQAATTNSTIVNAENVGLWPVTSTIDVNANTNFNYNTLGAWWVDIAANHNVAVAWSDIGASALDFVSMDSVWTLYDANGVLLIPPTVITNLTGEPGPTTLTNTFLSFFRPDGSSTPGNGNHVPHIRANRFGSGILYGTRADRLGLEIPSLLAINTDDTGTLTKSSTASGFPAVQLLNNDGTPGAGIVTGVNDAEAQAVGNVWCQGMEYLANGNIVIVSESRQNQELVDRFGGSTAARHVVYRVVTPAGVIVKATSLASSTKDSTELFGFGVGVTSNGFAIRFSYRPRADGSNKNSGTIRLFDNDGNPVSDDINESDAVGAFLGTGPNNPTGGNGGRGDSVGFHGNGKDAYVNVCVGDQEGVRGPVFVTVYNADGSVRYHRAVADAGEIINADQVDAAIAPDGRVVVAIDDNKAAEMSDQSNSLILGRILDVNGDPLGPLFYVSERENPFNATQDSIHPKVAWRDDLIAFAWSSSNSLATANKVLSMRLFNAARVVNPEQVGLSARTPTIDVNANTNFNYNTLGAWWVDIAANHNVAVAWSDIGASALDFVSMDSVWTLYDANGVLLIPPTVITNLTGEPGPTTLTNTFLSFFRPDGSSTPGNGNHVPHIRANRFGSGILYGTRADRLGLEIPSLLAINTDDTGTLTKSSTASGFPAVQLLNNDGTPGAGIVTGVNDAEAQAVGNVWCQGMEYLANGNIVIVSESRQNQELVDRFGGSTAARHVVYRVVTPAGVIVKATSLASSTKDSTELFGFGVGVTSNGFAIRFSYRPRADGSNKNSGTIRLFDNDGNPVSDDINESDAVGAFLGTGPNNPTGGNGGRGDSVGFHGNGKDAYVNVCIGDQEGVAGPVFITVYNANGSVRYHRPLSDLGETNYASQVDAAIAPDGRVIVATDDKIESLAAGKANRLVIAKMFSPTGASMGPLFYVSERETVSNTTTDKESFGPKVAWRDNLIAFAWSSQNSPSTTNRVVSLRLFNDAVGIPPTLSIAKSGGNAVLTWSATAPGYTLRSKASVTTAVWQTNSPPPVLSPGGSVYQVTEPIGPSSKFYQLIK